MDTGDSVPGATPLDDISGLRQRHLRTREELNAAEAENIRKVVVRYLISRPPTRMPPFDARWCSSLHRQMFGEVWHWAGTYRRTQTNLGVAPAVIESSMHELIEDVRSWRSAGLGLSEQSAQLHHRAVQIHPFLNGNGRWARMLSNIWRRHHHAPIVEWPEQTVGSSSFIRAEYLSALKAADGGDIQPLVRLEHRYTATM